MDLTGWTEKGVDRTRLRRLGFGYLVGAGCLAAAVTFAAATAASRQEPDEIIDVELASLPMEEEPEPEPAPEPEPEPVATPSPGPRLPQLTTPTEVPDDAPAEKDPSDSADGAGDPYADGAGDGRAGLGGPAAPPPPPPPPPPPTKPKPKPKAKVVRVTEDVTPPVPIAQSMPSYPSGAKAAGVEGTVVVKYVVTASGAVASVRAVRGPAELRATCEAVVRGWRFAPAILDGQPVAVSRIAQFPFRIKT